jgi:phage tail-like protein
MRDMSSGDSGNSNNFLYLNRDGCWADFARRGLAIGADGSLSLSSLPSVPTSPDPKGSSSAPAAAGSFTFGGVAEAADGTLYFSDPSQHRLYRIDACDGCISACGGIGEEGDRLWCPSGLLWHRATRRLFVADSINHRVLVLDPNSLQLLDVWDATGFDSPSIHVPVRRPVGLADDPDGNVYVLDYKARRIDKLDMRGNLLPGFWESVQQQQHWPRRPRLIAIALTGSKSDRRSAEVFVVDKRPRTASPAMLFIFDCEGRLLRRRKIDVARPSGLAVDANSIYLGDNESRQVVKFNRPFASVAATRLGVAAGYTGTVAALCLANDGSARVFINPGTGAVPVPLSPSGAFVKAGWMAGGPFSNPSLHAEQWHRLRMQLDTFSPSTHAEIFVKAVPAGSPSPPEIASTNPDQPPFAPSNWSAFPSGAPECLFRGAPQQDVWVGVVFNGEGDASPELRQMKLQFDYQTYINNLPAVFSDDAEGRQLLIRLLSLLGGGFEDVEGLMKTLPADFDPYSAPASFLSWLAGWLALDEQDNSVEAQRRAAIAGAYALYARRGTATGIREALRFFLGVDGIIEEPIQHASPWSLSADGVTSGTASQAGVRPAVLGFTTFLAAAEPQGAILGSSVLGQSQIVAEEDYGVPLFANLANRINVGLYRGKIGSARLDAVRALLQAEKPAHVLCDVCLIEPAMRVGFQARIGIDAIVAPSSTPATRLGSSPGGLVLGDKPVTIGPQNRVGISTRLGDDPSVTSFSN